MKYVLLGTLDRDWANKHLERTDAAKSKLQELGINLENVHYTQGTYDFVDVVDAPNEQAMVTFSLWYAAQGFGKIVSCPAFTPDELAAAAEKV